MSSFSKQVNSISATIFSSYVFFYRIYFIYIYVILLIFLLLVFLFSKLIFWLFVFIRSLVNFILFLLIVLLFVIICCFGSLPMLFCCCCCLFACFLGVFFFSFLLNVELFPSFTLFFSQILVILLKNKPEKINITKFTIVVIQ